jgi:hypothetical protein
VGRTVRYPDAKWGRHRCRPHLSPACGPSVRRKLYAWHFQSAGTSLERVALRGPDVARAVAPVPDWPDRARSDPKISPSPSPPHPRPARPCGTSSAAPASRAAVHGQHRCRQNEPALSDTRAGYRSPRVALRRSAAFAWCAVSPAGIVPTVICCCRAGRQATGALVQRLRCRWRENAPAPESEQYQVRPLIHQAEECQWTSVDKSSARRGAQDCFSSVARLSRRLLQERSRWASRRRRRALSLMKPAASFWS